MKNKYLFRWCGSLENWITASNAIACAAPVVCVWALLWGQNRSFWGQNRSFWGLDIHTAFLGPTWRVTAIPWLVSVHAGVKNALSCVCMAVKEYSSPTPSPPHSSQPGRKSKGVFLAKAHMSFLYFKCSSYYLDLTVYRVKETFMEQLRPVRT